MDVAPPPPPPPPLEPTPVTADGDVVPPPAPPLDVTDDLAAPPAPSTAADPVAVDEGVVVQDGVLEEHEEGLVVLPDTSTAAAEADFGDAVVEVDDPLDEDDDDPAVETYLAEEPVAPGELEAEIGAKASDVAAEVPVETVEPSAEVEVAAAAAAVAVAADDVTAEGDVPTDVAPGAATDAAADVDEVPRAEPEPKFPHEGGMPPVVEDADEEIIHVNAEFVWPEGAEREVLLSGSWNGWMPLKMYLEGESGLWSVVTPVPLGTHEFKFIVDGEWKTSSVHPVVEEDDDKVNIRIIKGKPDPSNYQHPVAPESAAKEKPKKNGCCVIS